MPPPNAERRPWQGGAPDITRGDGDKARITGRRWTGCPCGCMTKLPWICDPDCMLVPTGRELTGWARAVEHLHHAGLPAAVPPLQAAWLRHHGIFPDWETAA